MLHFVLYLTCTSVLCSEPEDTASIIERIPDVIDMFCPEVNVCRENRSNISSPALFGPKFWSCCTECNCRSNCTEDNSCCFPPMQSSTKEENEFDTLYIEKECLLPLTVQQNNEDKTYFQSFYMVTSVIKIVNSDLATDTATKCGDKIVAPWGSMFPMYSPLKRTIYKNRLCAEAHGVTDGVMWGAALGCNLKFIHFGASVPVEEFESYLLQHDCTVNFIPPTEIKNRRELQCYASLIDTCSDIEFQPPNGTGLSKMEIIKMCESGFISPLRDTKLYANIFCYICNTEFLLNTLFCNTTVLYDRGFGLKGFVGLIDTKFIDPGNGKIIHAGNQPMACDSEEPRDCRQLLCPSGQLRDVSGECKYLHKLWYNQAYVVNIILTSQRDIKIDEIDVTKALFSISKLLKKNWFIECIAYEVNGGTRSGLSLLVIVTHKISKVRPQNLMNSIKTLFQQTWKLHLKNDTLVFRPNFAKALNMFASPANPFTFGNDSKPINAPVYYILYLGTMYLGNIHYITKLNVCNQVELSRSEFVLKDREMLLIYIKTRQVLFDGEFILLSRGHRKKIARICIEDSGLFEIKNGLWKNNSWLFAGFVVIAIIYLAI